jgi:hypothetical protein
VRREQRVVEGAQRVRRGQRLAVVDVERGAGDAAAAQGLDQRGLVDEGAARRVDEEGPQLHAPELGRADEPARRFAEHEVNRDDVGRGQELVLFDATGRGLGRALVGEVGAPGEDVHAEGGADAGDPGAELAEAEHAEGLAVQAHADRRLPAALAHVLRLAGQVSTEAEK